MPVPDGETVALVDRLAGPEASRSIMHRLSTLLHYMIDNDNIDESGLMSPSKNDTVCLQDHGFWILDSGSLASGVLEEREEKTMSVRLPEVLSILPSRCMHACIVVYNITIAPHKCRSIFSQVLGFSTENSPTRFPFAPCICTCEQKRR